MERGQLTRCTGLIWFGSRRQFVRQCKRMQAAETCYAHTRLWRKGACIPAGYGYRNWQLRWR